MQPPTWRRSICRQDTAISRRSEGLAASVGDGFDLGGELLALAVHVVDGGERESHEARSSGVRSRAVDVLKQCESIVRVARR